MLSVYHASALSKRESPVLNGAPSAESLAGYKELMVLKMSCVTVDGSISRSLINVSNLAVSCAAGTLRFRTDWLKLVPSLSFIEWVAFGSGSMRGGRKSLTLVPASMGTCRKLPLAIRADGRSDMKLPAGPTDGCHNCEFST